MKSATFIVKFSAILCFVTLPCLSQKAPEQELLDLYNSEQYEEVIRKADSLLSFDKGINKARMHHMKADAYYFINDVERSLENYLKAIEWSDQYDLTVEQQLECNSHAGFCYKYLGKYIEALPYYHIALNIASSNIDSVEIANQASNLGTIYSQLGNYKKALGYLNTAYQIDFALKDTTALAYDLVNLGQLKLITGEADLAIKYLKEGLKVKGTKAGDHTTHLLRVGKLSQAFLANNQVDSAKFYNDLAIERSIEMGDSLTMHKQYITEAAIFNATRKFSSALTSARKAFNYFDSEDNSYHVSSSLQLAEAHIGLKNYTAAKRLLDRALHIAKANNLLEQSAKIYKRRAELNEEMGQSGPALEDFKNFQNVKDSLQKQDKQTAILILDQEYQTSKKQQQIELLEAKNMLSSLELARKKRDNIALIVILIFLLLTSCYVYYSIRKKNQLRNRLLTSEINELRLQIMAVMEGTAKGVKIESDALNASIQEPLSEREFEILNYALTDLSNTEIAEKAFVSVNTVKFHLKNVYGKLGVSSRKEALKYAIGTSSN